MSTKNEENESSFKVNDRRKFSRTKKDDAEAAAPSSSETKADAEAKPLGDNAGVYIPSTEEATEGEAPIDFGSFVISLGTNAYVAMGKVEDPETGETRKDPATARQMIQILEMLQTKTKGNLETEEAKLIESLLYELRMAFVEVTATKVNA